MTSNTLEVDRDVLLMLAGKLADAARVVGGGQALIGNVAPANIYTITRACERLREALDDYDDAIVDMARKR